MRALIVGTGAIGLRHIGNLLALRPEAELVLLRRSRDIPAALEDVPLSVVDDLEESIGLSPDLAIVSTPSALHIDVLPRLIESGIPTYVEKPVVTTRADAARLREALSVPAGTPHFTGFNLRLLPSLIAARETVRSGALGTITRASFAAGQWLPQWRPGQDHRDGYSGSAALGGGVIFDLSHELDSARSLLGEVELSACLTSHLQSLEIGSESTACILGRAASGALLTFSLDYVARRAIRRYELIGDRATLVWDLAARTLELHDGAGVSPLASDGDAFDVRATYVRAMQSFVDAALTGGSDSLLATLEDGLRSSELAIRAHELAGSA